MALKPTVSKAGWQMFCWAVMFDFVDDELRHQAVRDELDSAFVHLREELFAVRVDEAHVSQIDDRRQRFLARDRALPAFLKFGDAASRQSPFDEETDLAIKDSTGDS